MQSWLTLCIVFQFPPLREGRLMCMVPLNSLSGYFNSRPCARGDLWLLPAMPWP